MALRVRCAVAHCTSPLCPTSSFPSSLHPSILFLPPPPPPSALPPPNRPSSFLFRSSPCSRHCVRPFPPFFFLSLTLYHFVCFFSPSPCSASALLLLYLRSSPFPTCYNLFPLCCFLPFSCLIPPPQLCTLFCAFSFLPPNLGPLSLLAVFLRPEL